MGPKGDKERLDELKERLYARGKRPETRGRTPLSDVPRQVKRTWDDVTKKTTEQADDTPSRPSAPSAPKAETPAATRSAAQQSAASPAATTNEPTMPRKNQRNTYRMKVIVAGGGFFVLALILSSVFLFFGNNTISGANITIDVEGPFAVGGGDELPLQIAISNQNTVPIESATLIIEYPQGTQSASEPGRELFSERQQLNDIKAGEVVNVPVRAIVFGEENQEKEVNVSVEYRVRGSNATFFKEAEPLRFKISSSPVVLDVESVNRISSGQEAEITLRVRSNSPSPVSGVLVKATYPFGFDFTESEPSPVSGSDTWRIETLDPEEERTITLSGTIIGNQDEDRVFEFSVGVPNERDQFNLASTFTTVTSEIAIEQPFLGVNVSVNGETSETVAVSKAEPVTVRISFENPLDDTLYDGVIEAELSGNALNEFDVNPQNGFYDSTTNTITWDGVDVSALDEIAPGRGSSVVFQLDPDQNISQTPEIDLNVTLRADRVFEDRVPQELVGTTQRTIRMESVTSLTSATLHESGPFTNSGPTPPVVEELTQYTLSFAVANGSNDITDGEMTATLPQYVTWLDRVSAGDDVTYNGTTRTVTWDIGDVESNDTEEMAFQVSITPSTAQFETVPTLLETQRFRATDRFTGTVLRTDAPAITTDLFADPDVDETSGRVRTELDDE